MRNALNERIAPAFEAIIAASMVALAAALVLSFYLGQVKAAEEGILKAQLAALRSQRRVFRVVNGREPADLRELVQEDHSIFPMGAHELPQQPGTAMLRPEAVEAAGADRDLYPVDPWGKRYSIEPVSGRIHSVTPGYEDW